MQTLDLNALDRNRHAVEKDGVKYVVQPMTPRIVTMLSAADEGSGAERVTRLADAVAAILPTMPREMIDDFCLAQLDAVIKMSGTQVDAVEEYIADPNVPSSAVVATPLAEQTGSSTRARKRGSGAATSSGG